MRDYPLSHWQRSEPAELGFDPRKLADAYERTARLASEKDAPYRIVVVRGGRIAAEWNHGVGADEQLWLASACKSVFSSILGIAISEGVVASADARLVGYYPEALDVPQGEGPKAGRYVFPKDHAITFRQLISNTSGYMKPGEEPGRVFHYQTYGMNVLTHAISKAYGLWDVADPEGALGLKTLIDDRLRKPLGASWGYYLTNFQLWPQARINVFGYYDGIQSTALDMARLGWLWRSEGRWGEEQLIPAEWLQQATRTSPAIQENCPDEEWQYGYGFWVNDHGKLWSNLPRDAFAAIGAGKQLIAVVPSLDLVVVESPGFFEDHNDEDAGPLQWIINAC